MGLSSLCINILTILLIYKCVLYKKNYTHTYTYYYVCLSLTVYFCWTKRKRNRDNTLNSYNNVYETVLVAHAVRVKILISKSIGRFFHNDYLLETRQFRCGLSVAVGRHTFSIHVRRPRCHVSIIYIYINLYAINKTNLRC